MAHSSGQEPSGAQGPVYDEITEFFDLEAASMSPQDELAEAVVELLLDEPGLEFVAIAGQKQDEFKIWLKDALQQENLVGGSGPYVCHESADAWFGDDPTSHDGALTHATNSKPRTAPKAPRKRARKLPP
ncbi:hypothetical protein F4809DRAFT_645128 [Biscogniauxia mediterranea]|nr:hypothetical protein F4809DRAFT_645128 [Biscogniauxia mediterranea]